MWVALIVTLLIGGTLCGLCYGIIVSNDYDKEKLSTSSFRHEILKKPYERQTWGTYGYFLSEMTSEEQKKYEKYCKSFDKKQKLKKFFIYLSPALILILCVFFFAWVGANKDNNELKKEIASFESAKFTYETSLKNDDLTGFERMELVGKVAEQNQWLATKQEEVKIWYNFYLDKDILDVQPIKLLVD